MIFELRQYTLVPGRRDVLVDLFDRVLVAGQEATGMRIVGQFRDEDRPDRFVWVRGFPDMAERHRSLCAFYGGPVWRAHRDAANATMVDSDDVLLLRPAGGGEPFPPVPSVASARVTAGLCLLDAPVTDALVERFESAVAPALEAAGGTVLARLTTAYEANTFPALPVREGVHAFVWFARYVDPAAHVPGLGSALLGVPVQELVLAPTPASRLH